MTSTTCYVIGGTARHVVNGVESEVRRGSAFLLSPADFHEIVPTGGERSTASTSSSDRPSSNDNSTRWSQPALTGRRGRRKSSTTSSRLRPARARGRIGRTRPRGRHECGSVPGSWSSWPGAAAPSGRRSSGGRPGQAPRDDVRRAIAFAERHFREPIALGDAAAVAHLSPNYLSQLFREYHRDAVSDLSAEPPAAVRTLAAGGDGTSVADACHAAGFNSLSHFGRAYRRRYGESPSATSATSRSPTSTTHWRRDSLDNGRPRRGCFPQEPNRFAWRDTTVVKTAAVPTVGETRGPIRVLVLRSLCVEFPDSEERVFGEAIQSVEVPRRWRDPAGRLLGSRPRAEAMTGGPRTRSRRRRNRVRSKTRHRRRRSRSSPGSATSRP